MSELVSLLEVGMAYKDPSGALRPLLYIPHWVIEEGSWSMLVGPSGSGKTTLLNAMIGQTGSMHYSGTIGLYYERSAMAYVPQQACLVEQLGVRENLEMLYCLRSQSRPDPLIVEGLADCVRLSSFLDRPVGYLSGGERMKLALLRALILEPDILFLDEPSSHWDVETTHHVMNFLKQAYHEKGRTLVMVTHDTDLLSYATDALDVRACQVR